MTNSSLLDTPWKDWQAEAITGDASSRQYFRLQRENNDPLILMLDPPEQGGTTEVFAKMSLHLRSIGFTAPEILFHDAVDGRMVLSDLGPFDIADWLVQHPDQEMEIYSAVVELLADLQTKPTPTDLPVMDFDTAAKITDLAAIYYAKSPLLVDDLNDLIRDLYQCYVSPDLFLALRDFHTQNLIWRPQLSGHDRIGLLDFQDACLAPAGYDLMSLLRDARRDVAPDVAQQMVKHFQQKNPMVSESHLACVGAQRNLRILGIFARLSETGKPQYLDLIPRVWGQLMIDLNHAALRDLKTFVIENFPTPEGF